MTPSRSELAPRLRLVSEAATHVGMRRKNNQDAFLCDDRAGLWLVADGVGGRAAGEVASRTTAEAIQGELLRDASELAAWDAVGPARARRMMERAIQAATYLVFGMAQVEGYEQGMGTTVSALALLGGQLVSGQVGDSRIYRRRGDACECLTEDHTWVNWQLRLGRITREQAERSDKKNVITRAVGHREYVEVDTAAHELRIGDRFLLCSDGLHGYLLDGELQELLNGPRERVVATLVELANRRGGRDNITVVVVDAEPPSKSG